jgi:hypothetical protein
MLTGAAVALGVYLATNPYILINAFVNREVLKSNFGNSLAMYQIARIGEGFVRTAELTIEGATFPILVIGLFALVVAIIRKNRTTIPLVVVAVAFFLQFVLIGAGKPAEYGRFGIFTNTALAIGTAVAVTSHLANLHRFIQWVLPLFVVAWVGMFGLGYLQNFQADGTVHSSRHNAAERIVKLVGTQGESANKVWMVVPAEPAPYSTPPLDFSTANVVLTSSKAGVGSQWADRPLLRIDMKQSMEIGFVDAFVVMFREPGCWGGLSRETPISWANKPFKVALDK